MDIQPQKYNQNAENRQFCQVNRNFGYEKHNKSGKRVKLNASDDEPGLESRQNQHIGIILKAIMAVLSGAQSGSKI